MIVRTAIDSVGTTPLPLIAGAPITVGIDIAEALLDVAVSLTGV